MDNDSWFWMIGYQCYVPDHNSPLMLSAINVSWYPSEIWSTMRGGEGVFLGDGVLTRGDLGSDVTGDAWDVLLTVCMETCDLDHVEEDVRRWMGTSVYGVCSGAAQGVVWASGSSYLGPPALRG